MGNASLLGAGATRRLALLILALTMGVSIGCGEDAPPAPVAIQDLARCDITQSACQTAVYSSVAEMLEAEGFPMPGIRTISVDQHADEVRSGLDLEDLTGEDAATRGLRMLGFIPEASDSLTAAQADYWITQIAAYYRRNGRSITIIDRDYEPGSAQIILAHEFIHAIQDSEFNLSTVNTGAETEDDFMGVRSVVEGDAVFSSLQWYYDVLGIGASAPDWEEIYAESTGRLREFVADPEVALIDSASSFPYSYGFELMARATLAEGLSARADAFGAPPGSAVEVMAGYGAGAPVLSIPDVAHPAPLDGQSPEVRNRYGAWYVYGFLRRQGVADEEAWATALSWAGDELAIYDDGTEVVAVWRVRFDDATGAGTLADGVNVEGGDPGRSAVVFGDDAFIFAAESPETLLAWAEQPLDEMTAAIVLKGGPAMAGAVSVGNCMLLHDSWATKPWALLH